MARKAHAVWVSFAPLRKSAGGVSSELASVRYRMTIPAQAIPGSKLTYVGPGANRRTLLERFRPWSTAALFEELRGCDAVIIPSNPHDPRKAVKSPNRFTESLWAGRFVIAHPLPAYQALGAFGWVGDDLGEGLSWFRENPREAGERIQAGQAWIAQHCSREAVARAWEAVIGAS